MNSDGRIAALRSRILAHFRIRSLPNPKYATFAFSCLLFLAFVYFSAFLFFDDKYLESVSVSEKALMPNAIDGKFSDLILVEYKKMKRFVRTRYLPNEILPSFVSYYFNGAAIVEFKKESFIIYMKGHRSSGQEAILFYTSQVHFPVETKPFVLICSIMKVLWKSKKYLAKDYVLVISDSFPRNFMNIYKNKFSASIQQAIYLEKNVQLDAEKRLVLQPGSKGKVSNIDLYTCAEFIFSSDNFDVDVVERKKIKNNFVNERHEAFLAQMNESFQQSKKHDFFKLINHRIDCLYMKVSFDDSRKRHFLSFFDSLQCFLTSLNNLEEHLHAFTNSYIVLSRDKFSNLSSFIIGPLIAVGAVMLPIIMGMIYAPFQRKSFSVGFCASILLLNMFLLVLNLLDFEDTQLFFCSNVILALGAAFFPSMQEAFEFSAAFYLLALTFTNAFYSYACALFLVPFLVLLRFARDDGPSVKDTPKSKNE